MPVELSYVQAVILGIVEGLTEFLPISSTGHLTITEHLLGLPVDAPAVTAYTAIIQIGAIVATFIYFARKIARLFMAWVHGLRSADAREDHDYGLAWAVIVGSIPVGPRRLRAQGRHLRPAAQPVGRRRRARPVERGHLVGRAPPRRAGGRRRRSAERPASPCATGSSSVSSSASASSPGSPAPVRRSPPAWSAASTGSPPPSCRSSWPSRPSPPPASSSWPARGRTSRSWASARWLVGIVVAFVTAYASIAWLLRFVATNSLRSFVWYRVALGVGLAIALGVGWISAT